MGIYLVIEYFGEDLSWSCFVDFMSFGEKICVIDVFCIDGIFESFCDVILFY